MRNLHSRRVIRGLTLIELLVVILLVSLLFGLVTPALLKMRAASERQANLSEFLVAIGQLPYKAYLNGKVYTLSSIEQPIEVPDGWVVEVEPAIRYEITGLCSEGGVTLTLLDGTTLKYRIAPFACKPELISEYRPGGDNN